MARKTTRSYAAFLREYGNDTPDRGFTLAEQLQPVVVIDDAREISRKLAGPTVMSRMYRAALAGSYSIVAIDPGPAGLHIIHFEAEGNIRICVRNDTDGITANRAAFTPPVGTLWTPPMQSTLYTGTAVADPNPGSEFLQIVAGDALEDIWIPPNHYFIVTGIAANQLATAFVHYREQRDR